MADLPYTSADEMVDLAGQLGIELRADDDDQVQLQDRAADYGSSEVDFYCQGKYLGSDLAGSRFVRHAATAFGLEWWCTRRLNEVPASLAAMCERYREKLQLVLEGVAVLPDVARSRRPGTVTNQVVDLRRPNNQVRTDTTRSTGVARDYRRPTDPTAPDAR